MLYKKGEVSVKFSVPAGAGPRPGPGVRARGTEPRGVSDQMFVNIIGTMVRQAEKWPHLFRAITCKKKEIDKSKTELVLVK